MLSRIDQRWSGLLACVLVCLAQSEAGAGDPVAGKLKAAICTSCHGVDGNSQYPLYPKLAGQLPGYILKETMDFRTGTRTDQIMSNMITLIPEYEDIQDIAAYFSSQPAMQGQGGDPEMIELGHQLYVRERCDFCHADAGRPRELIAEPPPVIGGQHKEYLIKAMKDIQSSRRGVDLYGLMPRLLGGLSDHEIEAIAEFLSSL